MTSDSETNKSSTESKSGDNFSQENSTDDSNSVATNDRRLQHDLMDAADVCRTFSPPPPFLPLPLIKHEVECAKDPFPFKRDLQRETGCSLYDTSVVNELIQRQHGFQHSVFYSCSNCPCKCKNAVIVPKTFAVARKSLIEFAFDCCEFLASKLRDDVLFSALTLYDEYTKYQLSNRNLHTLQNQTFSKELLLGSVLLASKMDNVRHIGVKTCCGLSTDSPLAKDRILQHEKTLFLFFNRKLVNPSPCSFIKAILAEHEKEAGKTNSGIALTAYHMAVYILALNLMDIESLSLSAEHLGNACTWLVVLLLGIPLTHPLRKLSKLADTKQYTVICQHVMKRALQSCQNSDSSINRHFETSARQCVRKTLCVASQTSLGKIFLTL